MELGLEVELDMPALSAVIVRAVERCAARPDLELDVARSVLESLALRARLESGTLRLRFDFETEKGAG